MPKQTLFDLCKKNVRGEKKYKTDIYYLMQSQDNRLIDNYESRNVVINTIIKEGRICGTRL